MGYAHLGWLLANVAIPYLFPLVVVRLLQRLRLDLKPEQVERMRVSYLLRDAQLSVASVAIAAAAVYDLLGSPERMRTPLGITMTIVLIVLVVANSILFVCGAIIGSPAPTEALEPRASVRAWLKGYPLAAASLYLAFAVAASAFVSHFFTEDAYPKDAHPVTEPANNVLN